MSYGVFLRVLRGEPLLATFGWELFQKNCSRRYDRTRSLRLLSALTVFSGIHLGRARL